MEVGASLRQTVTHLFDAVRYGTHAKELDEEFRGTEEGLQTELAMLEVKTEEIMNLVSSMKNASEDAIRGLSTQLEEFLSTAKAQAIDKLERKARKEMEDYRNTAASERDKAIKSLEAYLASDPLPVVENVVQVRLTEGLYEARSRYECEGGLKYDFRLAAQNSRFFDHELTLSKLGYELKVPVRFSRALLKGRVPGFERLDQYVLVDAETSGGRIRANFERAGNTAKLKVVTSGSDDHGFVGLEYSDQTESVNVMNDPSLLAHVDLDIIRKAMGDLVKELSELAKKKVALLRFSLNGEESLDEVDFHAVLQMVLNILGPSYSSLVKKISAGSPTDDLSRGFLEERLKVLGGLSGPVAQSLGLQ
jgi:hypothetical protein